MWGRRVNGVTLTFHLAGINNQNFLMRDEETGSYWQQASGVALSGPLAGQALTLIPIDHLTFQQWKAEQPGGTVLKDVARNVADYAPKPWEEAIVKDTAREPVLGISVGGLDRAYSEAQVLDAKLLADRVGSMAVILVVGPDGKSIRAFRVDPGIEFFRTETEGIMIDSKTGSRWNFKGCNAQGKCLERIELTEDYWFDWKTYHPKTTRFHAPSLSAPPH